MILKEYIKKKLTKDISEGASVVSVARKVLASLDEIDFERLNYIVTLESLWKDHGGKTIVRRHKGNLKEAIVLAEEKFCIENQRKDVQAGYRVEIDLSGRKYFVPLEYWEDFKRK